MELLCYAKRFKNASIAATEREAMMGPGCGPSNLAANMPTKGLTRSDGRLIVLCCEHQPVQLELDTRYCSRKVAFNTPG